MLTWLFWPFRAAAAGETSTTDGATTEDRAEASGQNLQPESNNTEVKIKIFFNADVLDLNKRSGFSI